MTICKSGGKGMYTRSNKTRGDSARLGNSSDWGVYTFKHCIGKSALSVFRKLGHCVSVDLGTAKNETHLTLDIQKSLKLTLTLLNARICYYMFYKTHGWCLYSSIMTSKHTFSMDAIFIY